MTWHRSLRARLLLTVGLVLVVTLATVAFYARRATHLGFERLREDEQAARDRAFGTEARAALEAHHRQQGSFDGASALLRRLGGDHDLLLLFDPAGELLASSLSPDSEPRIELDADGVLTIEQQKVRDGEVRAELIKLIIDGSPVRDAGGRTVGQLFTTAAPRPDPRGFAFLLSVDRGLLLGVGLAGLLGLIAALLLSRRVLGPIRTLTEAARRMQGGDLSQRVEVEHDDEIGRLAHAFNAMADSLAQNERLRRRLVGDVAHELRTPLTNVRGQLEAIQDGLLTPKPEVIASLHEEVLLLGRLVDDLQELAAAEAGQLRLVLQPVALRPLVEQAAAAFPPHPAQAPIEVTVASDLPTVRADPERLGQILRNLLRNARTHAPPGGHIRVAARAVGKHVEVAVEDSGQGIAAAHLPHLFERFYRTDPSRQRATGSSGLGLAIVRELVTAQGGRAWAESEEGAGATFFFTLPLA